MKVCERCDMGIRANGVKYDVVEWVKRILRGGLVILRERRMKSLCRKCM